MTSSFDWIAWRSAQTLQRRDALVCKGAASSKQVARTSAFEVRGLFLQRRRMIDVGQIRVLRSEGIITRSMVRPHRRSCSAALIPEYSFTLDHRQPCGRSTSPALTGLRCMYSTLSLYSFTLRRARSKLALSGAKGSELAAARLIGCGGGSSRSSNWS